MSAPHAPGPWFLANVSQGSFEIWSEAPSVDGSYIICARNPIQHRAEQSEANARLIAAAPDLLAALTVLCDVDASTADRHRAYMEGRAAIAKATGQ